MKKLIILLAIIIIVGICWGLFKYYTTSMGTLPKGEFLFESISPNGTYTNKLYETNPALSVGGTRGEVMNNQTGKVKNIYWEYNLNMFEFRIKNHIIWESDEYVIINGISLNVLKDTYDWRRD